MEGGNEMIGAELRKYWIVVGVLSVALVGMGVAVAEATDNAETLLEQSMALAAEQAGPSAQPVAPLYFGAPVDYPLFIGVDDPAVTQQLGDAMGNWTDAFVGADVYGSAYDAANDRILFNDGSTLYEWPVGGAINMLGTITDPAGAAQVMVALAYYNGTLYSTRNIANEAVYTIDLTTLVATVYIDYVDADWDFGGLAADPNTGELYGTNDDATPNGSGLFRINNDATATLIAPYPSGQTDIDGLAVSDSGVAYLVIDEPGDIYPYDLVGGAYLPAFPNPWTSAEVFCGGAWITGGGGGGANYCDTPAVAIPDNDPMGLTASQVITDTLTIDDLDVFIDAPHTWSGDLIFTLTHVDTATSVTFIDRPGVPASTYGCGGNDYFVTVNDEGLDTCIEDQCSDLPAITGSAPGGDPCNATLMEAFDGQDIGGTWELTVSDNAGGDTGTLNEWCLVVNGGVVNPAITLDKTVGTVSGVCSTTDTITVPAGTEVFYCYEVTNTGDVAFEVHNLVDDQLGTILSGFAFVLAPGASVNTVDAGLTISTIVNATTMNTATWTAFVPGGPSAEATDSATVNVLFPDIDVMPLSMMSSQLSNEIVVQPLTIDNQGGADLSWSILEAPPALFRARNRNVQYGAPDDSRPLDGESEEQLVCADYVDYPGREPAGYADQCLGGVVPSGGQPQVGFSPTDTGYALDIGFVSDNFVSFTLNDFPGQTVVGLNAQPIFGMDFDSTLTTLYGLDNTLQALGTIDTATGAWTTIGPSVPAAGHTLTGLAVDPTNDMLYASTTDGVDSLLYTVDSSTGTLTLVGSMGTALMIDISINGLGQMYGHDIGTDNIYTIDMATGAATAVGPTGYDGNFAQGMDFDNDDGTLYIFLYIGGGANVYGTVDLATGAVTPLATDNPTGEFEGAVAAGGICSSPEDIPWLSVAPDMGTNGPGTNTVVDVTYDSTGIAVGTYGATLCVLSNDPDEPLIQVPVTMEVLIPVELLSIDIE